MGHKNREIEKKYVIADQTKTYNQVLTLFNTFFLEEADLVIKGAGRDDYWHPMDPSKADFIRVRPMPDGSCQLTIKYTDKGSTLDRVEIDVPIKEPAQAHAFMSQLAGPMAGGIFKKYTVFMMDQKDTSISLYKITGDSRVFVEIEARSVGKVDKLYRAVNEIISITHEPRSLYQLFLGDSNVKNNKLA